MTEFHTLVDQWLDGDITASQQSTLNRHLKDSDARLRQFAEAVNLHYRLRETFLADASLPSPLPAANAEAAETSVHFKASQRHVMAYVVAGVTCLMLLASLIAVINRTDREPTQAITIIDESPELPAVADQFFNSEANQVAILESSSDNSDDAVQPGKILRVGESFRLQRGTARLKFLSGASVVIAAPAAMEFFTPMKAFLRSGRLTATVNEAARGFTILTPHADVVDLGTRFGLNVAEDGNADVVVFDGAVDVHYDEKENANVRRTQRLTVGEALCIARFGYVHPLTIVQKGVGPVDWVAKLDDPTVSIAGVTDNFIGPDKPIYYGIIPRAFDEDAIAYVDRPYEWNSLPDTPFPEPLRGGDYVQTFNSLKFVFNLQIKLKLRMDSDVYILMDERVPPPTWLRSGFELTELRIGMDEYRTAGHLQLADEASQLNYRGVGPGQSVDYSYQIWKRHQKANQVVQLGSLLDAMPSGLSTHPGALSMHEMSMYGIVVVPTHSGNDASIKEVQ